MKRLVSVFAFCITAAIAGVSLAQEDLPAAREATMKEIGGAAAVVGRMVQGRTDFDGPAARAALEKLAAAAERFPTLFPEGSQPDGKALPSIWENKADFEARATKLSQDAAAAAATAENGLDALKASFGPIGAACQSCHQLYRAPS